MITAINAYKNNNNLHNQGKIVAEKTSSDKSNSKALGIILAATGLLLGGIILKKALTKDIFQKQDLSADFKYLDELAKSLSTVLDKKVKTEQLKSVMGKNELFSILPKMQKENYISFKNTENGIFKIDLHSHSNYSDGQGDVQKILNQAAEYGDRLHSKNGEKFIFALSDHDTLDGVKEALKIIAKNPEKYDNIRFVPAVELSFVHKADNTNNPTEGSELLAHCINPFSENLNILIDNVHKKRSDMINNALQDLSEKIPDTKFLKEEMDSIYLKKPNENFAYNLHWRIYNYAQVKYRTAQIAKEQNKNPETLYKELMDDFRIDKNQKSPYNFNQLLKDKRISTATSETTQSVDEILSKYFPKVEGEKINSSGENSFDDIIETLSKEKNVSLGFAHPYFLAEKFKNPEEAITNFIHRAKGLIQTSESFHQAYPDWLKNNKAKEIDAINEITKKHNLLPTGGRDNHSANLL